MRIDVGLGGSKLVKLGDRATFDTKLTVLGPSLRGKALDDRLGVFTIIQLLKNAPENVDLLAAFTVQEELGLRGAKIAAYHLNPDIGIALDSTPANDLPHFDGEENTIHNTKLDGGPAIYLMDGATIGDRRLIKWLSETADAEGIPWQYRQPGRGGTDAGSIHRPVRVCQAFLFRCRSVICIRRLAWCAKMTLSTQLNYCMLLCPGWTRAF